MQYKTDGTITWPDGMSIGPMPVGGQTWREEIHINGVTNQASFHLDTNVVKLCVLLDAPPQIPPLSQIEAQHIDQMLHAREEFYPQQVAHDGVEATLDGEDVVAVFGGYNENGMSVGVYGRTNSEPRAHIYEPPEPVMRAMQHYFSPPPNAGDLHSFGSLKVTGFSDSVGDVFSTRACSIGSQSNAMAMFEAHPHLTQFVKGRIDARVKNMQDIAHPRLMNGGILQTSERGSWQKLASHREILRGCASQSLSHLS